jgi:D-3-phosphoglycerate dehydrogenase / 2-oxoglutarate reductase
MGGRPATASRRVVITDCDHGDIAEERGVLDAAGVDLRLASCRTADEVAREGAGATVLINQYAPITAQVLDALPSVRLVVRYGVGVDNVDVDAATRVGVWVANVPDYGTEEVADHALALGLTLLRGVAVLERSVRDGRWNYEDARPLRRLRTLTFGVVGCGAIGTAVAARACAFGMRVVGCDARPGRAAAAGVEELPFDELLRHADVVSLHATLDERGTRMIDGPALAEMKPSAVLVNTARGGLVDTAALLAALEAGQLAGAALDVLDVEPPDEVGVRLATHPRVVVTPHAAWYSEESFSALKTEVAREALRVLEGLVPRSPVNAPLEIAS